MPELIVEIFTFLKYPSFYSGLTSLAEQLDVFRVLLLEDQTGGTTGEPVMGISSLLGRCCISGMARRV